MDETFSTDHEQAEIDGLARAYAALDASREDERGELWHELLDARLRRMERVSMENWKILEEIAGRSIRA